MAQHSTQDSIRLRSAESSVRLSAHAEVSATLWHYGNISKERSLHTPRAGYPNNQATQTYSLLKKKSLMRFCDRTLALFISVLLLSESVAATPARMDISIAQQPAATSQDAAAAQRIFQEGVQLYRQQTAESLRQAIAKWEQALPLYRAVGDKKQEATTLNNIGRVYSALGEKQKALDYRRCCKKGKSLLRL